MSVRRNTILVGDAAEQLRTLPAGFVDCVVTSPPYFQLRDYGVEGQLGLEPTVNEWVQQLRDVFAEVARVMKPTGSLWLNVGDSYSTDRALGAPAKGQLLAPERLLLAMAQDGWILRNKVVWAKPNAMPTSVRDRLNTTHEFLYFFVRSARYFFDLDAVREPHRSRRIVGRRTVPDLSKVIGPLAAKRDGLSRPRPDGVPGHPLGKNPGDVWSIATRSFREAHFATFPEELIRRPLLATCPAAACGCCGATFKNEVETACSCGGPVLPGLALDPFMGAGTLAVAAQRLHRDWIGIELNPSYAAIAEARIAQARAPNATRPLRAAA